MGYEKKTKAVSLFKEVELFKMKNLGSRKGDIEQAKKDNKMQKGKGGKPSTTGNPSGGGRDNNPPKPKK